MELSTQKVNKKSLEEGEMQIQSPIGILCETLLPWEQTILGTLECMYFW